MKKLLNITRDLAVYVVLYILIINFTIFLFAKPIDNFNSFIGMNPILGVTFFERFSNILPAIYFFNSILCYFIILILNILFKNKIYITLEYLKQIAFVAMGILFLYAILWILISIS